MAVNINGNTYGDIDYVIASSLSPSEDVTRNRTLVVIDWGRRSLESYKFIVFDIEGNNSEYKISKCNKQIDINFVNGNKYTMVKRVDLTDEIKRGYRFDVITFVSVYKYDREEENDY